MQYLDKRLFVQLNGSRKVIGVLRGYDVLLKKLSVITFYADKAAGLPKHRLGRRRRGEGRRGEGQDRHGGKFLWCCCYPPLIYFIY